MGFSSQSEQNRQEPAVEDSGHFFKADDADVAAVAKSKRASSAGEAAPRRARKSEAADPMLPEKKRARRRLVGAIALALAVAVGLPMILDSEPKPLGSDIAIQIPSKDKVALLPVPAAAPVQAPSQDVATVDAGAALSEGEEIVEAPPAAAPFEAKTPPVAEVKAPAKVEPAKPEPVKPAPKTAEKPAAKPADDASRALAILEGKAAAQPKAAAGQKFVVQVGAFSSQETVSELRSKMSAAGIASYTQKTASGATRVRVGPFATRAEADAANAKLKKIGLSSTFVTD